MAGFQVTLYGRIWVTAEDLHDELLQGLQQEYALEQDTDKKREILQQMLDLILSGWEQLFLSFSKEENPQKVLLLLAELNRVSDGRRGEIQETDTPRT